MGREFMRGRMDIKGQCGCAWSHVCPGVAPYEEAEIEAEVRAQVVAHAERYGHSPTIVIVREEFYAHVAMSNAPEAAPAEA